MKENGPRYAEDDIGFYDAFFEETQHIKARPIDFEMGEMVIDDGDRAQLREIRRQLVAEMNGQKRR